MSFVGRENELAKLNQLYQSSQMEFVPIYGRRRVGKSELIFKFIQNKPALYFLGKEATEDLQIKEFLETAARVFRQPLLAELNILNWKQALTKALEYRPKDKKLILVLDEFQWIAQASSDLPSVLQEFLDRDWKRSKNILLILCGSYLGFMEREVLGEKSPLFGRRTAQIFLKPFGYREAAQFHPRWSLQDRAQAYFVCGGIPLYLNFFSTQRSLLKNIEVNFFDEFSPLFREPDFLLREELRELQKYYTILMSLALGKNTNQTIAAYTGIEERKLYYYLQQLIHLGYVQRRFPLSAEKPTPQQVRFILADPMLRFWFRFVFPHLAYITQVGPKLSFQNVVKPNLESYFGYCFESLCREALAFLYQQEGITSPFEVGEYWNKQTQIDIVGYRAKEQIDLGECKWGRVRSLAKLAQQLEAKQAYFPNRAGLSIQNSLFIKKRPAKTKGVAGIKLYDLKDLYE